MVSYGIVSYCIVLYRIVLVSYQFRMVSCLIVSYRILSVSYRIVSVSYQLRIVSYRIGIASESYLDPFFYGNNIVSFTLRSARKANPFGSVPDPLPCKRNEIVPISYTEGTDLFDPYLFLCVNGVQLAKKKRKNLWTFLKV